METSGGFLAHEIPDRVLADLLSAVHRLAADVAKLDKGGAVGDVRRRWLEQDIKRQAASIEKLADRVKALERAERGESGKAGAIIAGGASGSILYGLIELAQTVLGAGG